MQNIKKYFNFEIVSITALLLLLCNSLVYSCPVTKDSLRVPTGDYKRLTTIQEAALAGLVQGFKRANERSKEIIVDGIFTAHLGMPFGELLQYVQEEWPETEIPLQPSNIFILNANPGLDLFINWEKGPSFVNLVPNGKGAYAAQVLANSGVSSHIFGFYGGVAGKISLALLEKHGIEVPKQDIVYVPDTETRRTVLFEGKSSDNYLVTKGGMFEESHARILLDKIDLRIKSQLETLPQDEKIYFHISGSLPPGIPESFYRDVIQMLRQYDDRIYILLDAKGNPLYNGIQGAPDMVKINEAEFNGLSELMHQGPIDLESSDSEITAHIRRLFPDVPCVVITRGEKPTVYLHEEELARIEPWSIDVVDATGAGDTMGATILDSLSNGHSLKDALFLSHVAAAETVSLGGGNLGKSLGGYLRAKSDI